MERSRRIAAAGVNMTGSTTSSFLGRFTVLRGAVRELWIIFGAKFLAILAYRVMNLTLALWLSSDLGYSDEYAGYLVAIWSLMMTLFTVLVGRLWTRWGCAKRSCWALWFALLREPQ